MAISATQAIGDYWDSRPDISGLFADGKLYAGEAPATVGAMPYAVVTQVAEPVEDYTTGYRMYRGTYQVSCMADDLAEAESLSLAVGEAFHHAPLSISGASVLHCLAGETRWTLGKGLGLGGQDCWVAYVELEIYWSR